MLEFFVVVDVSSNPVVPTVARISPVVDVRIVAGVLADASIHAFAGVPCGIFFPAVHGSLTVADFPSIDGVLVVAGVLAIAGVLMFLASLLLIPSLLLLASLLMASLMLLAYLLLLAYC